MKWLKRIINKFFKNKSYKDTARSDYSIKKSAKTNSKRRITVNNDPLPNYKIVQADNDSLNELAEIYSLITQLIKLTITNIDERKTIQLTHWLFYSYLIEDKKSVDQHWYKLILKFIKSYDKTINEQEAKRLAELLFEKKIHFRLESLKEKSRIHLLEDIDKRERTFHMSSSPIGGRRA